MEARISDGFYTYLETVTGAEIILLKAGPSQRFWHVESRLLHQTVLQFGTDGGPRIYHGITYPNMLMAIIQTTGLDNCVTVDGVNVDSNHMVILPPGCHFTFVCDLPASWVTWSIPLTFCTDLDLVLAPRPSAVINSEKYLLKLTSSQARQFVKIAKDGWDCISNRSSENQLPCAKAIELRLLDEVKRATSTGTSKLRLPEYPVVAPENVVFKALAYIRSKRNAQIHVYDLVKHTKVSYRTLLRAFELYLKTTPKRYLKLHQLNMVNQAICRSASASNHVLDILAGHGVSEFGRFAGEYKAIFGEIPSETNQRYYRDSARAFPRMPPTLPVDGEVALELKSPKRRAISSNGQRLPARDS